MSHKTKKKEFGPVKIMPTTMWAEETWEKPKGSMPFSAIKTSVLTTERS